MKPSLRSRTKSAPAVVPSTAQSKLKIAAIKMASVQENVVSPIKFLSAKSVYQAAKKRQPKPTPKTPIKQSEQKKLKTNKKTPNSSSKKRKSSAALDISENELLSLELDEASDKSNEENHSSSGYNLSKACDAMDTAEKTEEAVATVVEAQSPQLPTYTTLEEFDFVFAGDTAALVFIPFQTCFYFKGRMKITVLSGVAEIQGYYMDENIKKSHHVYSPRGYSLQCIRSIGKSSKKRAVDFNQWIQTHGLTLDKEVLERKSCDNVLLFLQPLDGGLIDYLSRLFKPNILRKQDCAPPHWDLQVQNKLNQLCFRLDSSIIIRGAVFSAR